MLRRIARIALVVAPAAYAVEWDLEYRPSRLPEEAIPGIEFFGEESGRELREGALHLTNGPRHSGPWADYVIRGIGALNSRGVTLEARVKAVSAGGEHFLRPGIELFVADNYCAEAVVIRPDGIETKYSLLRRDLPLAEQFHVFRITARGDDFGVYVDGELAIDGKGRFLGGRTLFRRLTWPDSVKFGAGSKYVGGEGYIELLRYSTKGAFAPDGSMETFERRAGVGRKIAIKPVGNVVSGMAEGLNGYDSSVPKLGGEVEAQILHDGDAVRLWLQNATTKVFRTDTVKPSPVDPRIAIALAGNEYEPFQIVLRPKVGAIEDFRLEFSDLVGRAGRIRKRHLTFNPLAYLKVLEPTVSRKKVIGRPGYWPDGLLPYESFAAKHTINYPIWVTLYCPEGTPPGLYRGTITVHGSRFDPIVLPIEVKVWGFTLPRTPRANVQFLLNNVYNSAEKSMEAYQAQYRLVAARRGSPSRLFPGLKFEIRDGEVWIDPENAKFIEMARYCIDELGVKRFWFPHVGPHQMIGWFARQRKGRQWLGVSLYKDQPPYSEFTPEFEQRLVDYLRKASAFLKSKGLFDHFNCLTSHNEPACPPAWRDLRSFKLEARYCDLVHQADPDYRVFINMALVVGEPELSLIKDKVSIWAENTLGSKFQLFDRVGLIPPQLVAERQAAGDEVLMYRNSHDYIDTGKGHSAMNHRVNGWIMWVTGATGYYFDNGGLTACLWSTNAWRRIGRKWHGETQWGAGSQLYPGVDMTTVHSSIRLELNREGYEDYEYLMTLAELDKQGRVTPEQKRLLRKLEEAIVPLYTWWRDGKDPDRFWEEGVYEGSFESDARRIYHAREQLGEMIDGIMR